MELSTKDFSYNKESGVFSQKKVKLGRKFDGNDSVIDLTSHVTDITLKFRIIDRKKYQYVYGLSDMNDILKYQDLKIIVDVY